MSLSRFLEKFETGSSFALVGNGGSALSSFSGERIEKQRYVARFNLPHVLGYEKYVGRRTDVLFCNAFQDPTTADRLRELSPRYIVCFLSRRESPEVLRAFEKWSDGFETWQTLTPDLAGMRNRSSLPLMSGTYALALIAQTLRPSHLFLTGFSFFKGTCWQDHYWENRVQPSAEYHDPLAEARVFSEILERSSAQVETATDLGLPGVRSVGAWEKASRRIAWSLISAGLRLRRLSSERAR